MTSTVIRIDQWQSTRESAIRQAQLARFEQRQDRTAVEALEWPAPPALSWRDQIAGLAVVVQMLWWVATGKVFRAM